jgi:hypothetical protein
MDAIQQHLPVYRFILAALVLEFSACDAGIGGGGWAVTGGTGAFPARNGGASHINNDITLTIEALSRVRHSLCLGSDTALASVLTWQVDEAQSTEKRITTNHTNGIYRAPISARIPGKLAWFARTTRTEKSNQNATPIQPAFSCSPANSGEQSG